MKSNPNKTVYLYVKTSPKGLKYLGVTTKNPFSYKGSGVYWRKHLKCYKFNSRDIKTEIIFSSINRDEIKEKGLYFSKLWNIIESDEWANLCYEAGEFSSLGHKMPEYHKEKLLKIIKGRKRNDVISYLGISVFNKETGSIFNSIKEAAESIGISPKRLSLQLNKGNTTCKFEYMDKTLIKPKKVKQEKKLVRISDGKIFESINEAARSEGMGLGVLNNQLLYKRKKCKFKYYEET